MAKTAQSVQLAIQCKRTEVVDVKGPLVAYVNATYDLKHADECSEDLAMISQLRAEVTASLTGGTPGLRDSLAKWA